MRGAAVGICLILLLLGGLGALYYWVPVFKSVAMGTGRALTGPEVLLIRLSDVVVIHQLAVIPVVFAVCVWIGCMAFGSDHESPNNGS